MATYAAQILEWMLPFYLSAIYDAEHKWKWNLRCWNGFPILELPGGTNILYPAVKSIETERDNLRALIGNHRLIPAAMREFVKAKALQVRRGSSRAFANVDEMSVTSCI